MGILVILQKIPLYRDQILGVSPLSLWVSAAAYIL